MFELDNPGDGDCLFYSIVAGLIHFIQTNPDKEQARLFWNKWATEGGLADKDCAPLSFEEILETVLTHKPQEVTPLKLRLQNSLRRIAANAMLKRSEDLFAAQFKPNSEQYISRQHHISQLNEQLKDIDSLCAEVDAQENPARLLQERINDLRAKNGYKNTPEIDELNLERRAILESLKTTAEFKELTELRNSKEATDLRNQRSALTANQVGHDTLYVNFRSLFEHYQSPEFNPITSHNLFFKCDKARDLAKRLATKLNGDKELLVEMTQEDNRKILLLGVEEIKKRHHWGNAEQAIDIFKTLEVNFSIQKKGEALVEPHKPFGDNAPMVYLINIADIHWITGLDRFEPSFEPTVMDDYYSNFNEDYFPEPSNSPINFIFHREQKSSFTEAKSFFNPSATYPKRQIPTKNQSRVESFKGKENISPLLKEAELDNSNPQSLSIIEEVDEKAFLEAANYGNLAIVRKYLECNQDIPFFIPQSRAWEAFLLAATNGHLSIVNTLIKAGVSVHTVDVLGNTALHWAAWHGHLDVVELLLLNGAKVTTQNNKGCTAKLSAQIRQHEPIFKLLDHAEKTAKTNSAPPSREASEFFLAVEEGDLITVLTLMDSLPHSAYAMKNELGENHLIIAAKNGHLQVVRALLQSKKFPVDAKNRNGDTALIQAAAKGHFLIVDTLVKAGASILLQNEQGEDALQKATENSHSEIIDLLISLKNSEQDHVLLKFF